MIQVSKTELPGVLLVKPSAFEDHRGFYVETYNEKLYRENGINIHFVQDDISVSYKNVLRGIHGDPETWKLVSCLYGAFYLVVVNLDKNSEYFGKWVAFTLSAKNNLQVLIPPWHGNGHLVLTDVAIFHYKQSTYYNPKIQFTYKWDDPALNIWWPVKTPILSRRDEVGRYVD
ncbi:MAG: dTDP-4-dehydrorhamnose 3,5-epimerase [Dehalococcoidia bacterium]|nr:dTDP-4-dehydrorhamnose 3,5-epimerase [Dehalococcoidia bacterium]